MTVSVLIGTRNRVEPLYRCLESVFCQDGPLGEVLILDDCSSRYDVCDLLKKRYGDPRLRCFRSAQVLGVAGGRNYLMQRATGEILCVLDDDAVLADSGCLSRMATYLEQHPEAGILSFKLVDYTGGQPRLLVPFSRRWLKRRPHLSETRQVVSYYLGGFHAIRRSLLESCGGYHPGLFFGEEELDLSYRAIESGFQIHYLPEVTAYHYPEPPVAALDDQPGKGELFYHLCNRLFLAYKYLPALCIPVYLTVWLGIYGLRAIRRQTPGDFCTGLVSGLRNLKKTKRTPLSLTALTYLRNNYGRIWY